MPEVLTSTNQKFLQYDSGPVDKDRLLIFYTDEGLRFLALCCTWFMDGTVGSGPKLFDQLYTLHGWYLCKFNWNDICLY